MSDSSPPLSKLMVETLIKGLEEAGSSIKSLQTQEHTTQLQLVEVKGKLDNISDNVNDIKKVVKGNNGKDSLLDRVTATENDLKNVKQFVEDYKTAKKEQIQGKWQLRGVWIASSLGLIGGLAAAVISLLGH